MRILVIGRQFPDSFARNIALTLADMGHDVICYDEWHTPAVMWARQTLASGRVFRMVLRVLMQASPWVEELFYQPLVRLAVRTRPDLVLNTYNSIPPHVIRAMKEATKAKIALWFPDHLANLGRQYVLTPDYDGLFFKEPHLVRLIRANLGLQAYYLPEACNPKWHHPVVVNATDLARYGCDLAIAGNMYPWRDFILREFVEYDLKIWGDNFPRWLSSPLRSKFQNRFIAESEKAKAFNAAKIVLNTLHYAEIEGVNCRLFEAAGCGAFQIVEFRPGLPELFEEGKEVVVYRRREELKELVDYYLARPEERRRIGEAAWKRAHREHTYAHRLTQMLEVLGLAGP